MFSSYFTGNAVITFPNSSITTLKVYTALPLVFTPTGLLKVCSKTNLTLPVLPNLTIKLSPFKVLLIPSFILKLELKWDLAGFVEFDPCNLRM